MILISEFTSRFELSEFEVAKLLSTDARSVRNWKTERSHPNATGKAVMIGLIEAIDRTPAIHKSDVRNEVRKSILMGGVSYLIVRLFQRNL